MIWYTEFLTVPDQPTHSTVHLTGLYNGTDDPTVPAVVLKAEFQTAPDHTALVVTLYSHSPAIHSWEEPTSDELRQRYYSQIQRARQKLLRTTFNHWFGRTA